MPEAWVEASYTMDLPHLQPKAGENLSSSDWGYGYQWWLPPAAKVGEYFAIGIYGQYIYVDTARRLVISLNSADRNFKECNGQVTLNNLRVFQQISKYLE